MVYEFINDMGFCYPVDFIGITQAFNDEHPRDDFGWNNNHGGKNQPIYSARNGIVIAVEKQEYGGNVIFIKHYNGYCTSYGHLEKVMVKKGEKVGFHQQIGTMGNTGKDKKTGKKLPYHLDFGLYKGDKVIYKGKCYVDPIKYLCVFKCQKVANGTKNKYKLYYTKLAENIPDEPLLIRDKANTKGKVVGKIYNGNEVTSYGKTLTGWNIVDNTAKYYCYNKWLKDRT